MNITSSNDDTAQVDDGFWQCSSSSDSDDGEFEQGVREEGDVRQREEGMGVGATEGMPGQCSAEDCTGPQLQPPVPATAEVPLLSLGDIALRIQPLEGPRPARQGVRLEFEVQLAIHKNSPVANIAKS
eukprot:COSAG01_NODE_1039_length_11962_cov_32.853494_11_plen_128_part_00